MERITSGIFSGEDILQQLSTNSLDDVEILSSSLESTKLSNADETTETEAPNYLTIKKFNLTDAVKAVFNYDDSINAFPVVLKKAPDLPPNKLGVHEYVVDPEYVTNLRDLRRDYLDPWNKSDGTRYNIDKVGLFIKNGEYKAAFKNIHGADDVANILTVKHPTWNKIRKRILWAKSEDDNSLVSGTFIIIVYEMEELYEISELPVTRRLLPSTSKKLDSVILGRTGTEARNAFYSNGEMFNSADCLPSLTQIRNKQSHSDEWEPRTTRGRPRQEDPEEVRRIIDKRYIVRAHYDGDDPMEERYLLATKAHLYLYEKFGLYPTKMIQKFVDDSNALLNFAENERNAKVKELVQTDSFKQHHRCGQNSIDITFNLGRFNVTMILCTLQHINATNEKPYSFVPAIMLSRERKKEDMKWFAAELEKQLGGKGKSARCLASDGERALDYLQECSIFAKPTVRIGCARHDETHVEQWCNKDMQIVQEIFGAREDSFLKSGFIHEFTYEKFNEKIKLRATSDEWMKYEELQRWAASEPRLRRFYERHNILSCLASGYALERNTTDTQECMNQVLKHFPKYKMKDNIPLQDSLKGIEKFMVEQLVNLCHVFFDNDPACHLRDQKKFLGPVGWAKLNEEQIRTLLKEEIGIIDSDLLPGLKVPITTFPAALATNTNETQRKDMVSKAKTYTVTECDGEPGVYFVRKGGSSTRTINITRLPIFCECKIASKSQQVVCHHILAVALKKPDVKLLEKIENYINSETVPDRNTRLSRPEHGSKPRHPRRTGNFKSRNRGKDAEKTTDIITLESDALSTSSASTLTGVSGRKRIVSGSEGSNSTVVASQLYYSDLEEPASQKKKGNKKRTPSSKHASVTSSNKVITLGDTIDQRIITLDNSPPVQQRSLIPSSSKNRLPRVPENPNKSSSSNVLPPSQPQMVLPIPLCVPRPSRPYSPRVIMPRYQTAPSTLNQPIALNVSRPVSSFSHSRQPNPPAIPTTSSNKSYDFNAAANKQNEKVREAVDNYIDQNGIILSYLNYYPFVITKLHKLSGWKQRNCIKCGNSFGDNPETIVIAHFESYEHPSFQGTRNGIRAICPTKLCMNQRYPFINKECFVSDLNPSETTRFLNQIILRIQP